MAPDRSFKEALGFVNGKHWVLVTHDMYMILFNEKDCYRNSFSCQSSSFKKRKFVSLFQINVLEYQEIHTNQTSAMVGCCAAERYTTVTLSSGFKTVIVM